jgi:hypothetical protein
MSHKLFFEGLGLGVIFFLLIPYLSGNFGIFGMDSILPLLPNGLVGFMLVGVLYSVVLGFLPLLLDLIFERHQGSWFIGGYFSSVLGVAVSYVIFLFIAFIALSYFGF